MFHFLTEDVGPLEESGIDDVPYNQLDMEHEHSRTEISLHTMAGQVSPRTLRLKGKISALPVQTLVDGGSTHNFIQEFLSSF